jgi:predicted nucleic acid-binding protein
MAVLADSSVLIRLERLQQTLATLTRAAREEDVAVASMSISELSIGAIRANTLERRQRRHAFIEHIVATLQVFPFDTEAARFMPASSPI